MGLHVKFVVLTLKKCIGILGKNFIEIHHIKPMYIVKKEVSVNPNTDLIPLYSNCHKMVHRNKKSLIQ